MKQISASLEEPLVKSIKDLCFSERRSFSEMVAILLEEAVEKRIPKSTKKQ